ncbi:MAG: DUF4956 domain-containing protein [Suipraeoptans sp.]
MLDSILTNNVTVVTVSICTITSLILGMVIALVYMFRNTYSRNFVITIVLLPAMVQSVIMVVNGNLGAGVAVMGAFSLVRFRSAPGSAKEIVSIFFAMASGLAAGMGYIIYAVFFTVIMSIIMMALTFFNFGDSKGKVRTLKVTIPEDLNYIGLFDDLFKQFTTQSTLERARTTNLGSLYELQYTICLRDMQIEKQLIDELRKRNGNLNISISLPVTSNTEL